MSFGREELRLLIQYEWMAGLNAMEATDRINRTVGKDTVNKATCYRWMRKFEKGDVNLKDGSRPGAPKKVDHEGLLKRFAEDQSITTHQLGQEFGCSHSVAARSLKEGGWVYICHKHKWEKREVNRTLEPEEMEDSEAEEVDGEADRTIDGDADKTIDVDGSVTDESNLLMNFPPLEPILSFTKRKKKLYKPKRVIDRERVIQKFEANPTMSAARVAKEMSCSRGAVRQILRRAGYVWEHRQRVVSGKLQKNVVEENDSNVAEENEGDVSEESYVNVENEVNGDDLTVGEDVIVREITNYGNVNVGYQE